MLMKFKFYARSRSRKYLKYPRDRIRKSFKNPFGLEVCSKLSISTFTTN